MGRPKKNAINDEKSALTSPGNAPAAGGSVMSETPVREQIKQMSGFKSPEELAEALPETTATIEPPQRRKRRTKAEMEASRPVTLEADPLMSDPRYKEAVGNMTSFGAPRAIKAGFNTGAIALKDERIKLDSKEQKEIEDYFYVVGKKANFDPTSKWYLILYFFVLMAELVGKRLIFHYKLESKLAGLLGFGAPEEPKSEEASGESREASE